MSERNTAIVLAAGQGKRMHSKVQKQFLEIQGYPVLYYSLRCFQESPLIQDIILVTGEESISYCKEEIVQKYGFTKVSAVIPGGKERYDSVYAGLCECRDCEYVLIHDGARPFVTEEILKRGLQKVKETGACVIGMPSKDTVKLSDEEGYVKETPNRKCVWTIQTPQIFSYSLIREAHDSIRHALNYTPKPGGIQGQFIKNTFFVNYVHILCQQYYVNKMNFVLYDYALCRHGPRYCIAFFKLIPNIDFAENPAKSIFG